MRLRAAGLPGVTVERVDSPATIEATEIVYQGGSAIGAVVYVRRPCTRGTEYGWRPAESTGAALSSKADAIRRLPGYRAES